jgi:PAS domain S-box-containing protein
MAKESGGTSAAIWSDFPGAVLIADDSLAPIGASRKCCAMFGVRLQPDGMPAALVGLGRALAAEPGLRTAVRTAAAAVRAGERTAEFRWERAGRAYDVSLSLGPPTGEGLATCTLLFQDVTRQLRMEETSRDARRYLEDILQSLPLGVVVLDREMRIAYWNTQQEELLRRLGTAVHLVDAVGLPIAEVLPPPAGMDWEGITQELAREDSPDIPSPQRVRAAQGEAHLDMTLAPLRGERGRFAGAIVISEDVTERVRLEGLLQAAQIRAEKLETIRSLVVTVNHEINNPLTSILATAQMLRLTGGLVDPSAADRLRSIDSQVKRIATVLQRLWEMEDCVSTAYRASGPQMIDLESGG